MNKAQRESLKNVSVSHGTMNPEDLIPAFCDFYENETGRKPKIDGLTSYINHLDSEFTWKDLENEPWLIEDLFDKLNDIAPDGFYFGAHPGDGSDYGFWECEDY